MTPRDGERQRLSRELREGALRAEESSEIASETVWAAVRGELPPAELRELLDRSIDDPQLALEWQLARELQAEMASDSADSVTVSRRLGGFRRRFSMVAASLLVAVLATWFIFRPVEDPVYRAPEKATIESLLPQDQVLSAARPVLRWSGPPEGRYQVSVMRQSDLREVFKARDLTVGPDGEGAVELAPDTIAGLEVGSVLLWRVEGELPDGERIQSQTFRVRWAAGGAEAPRPTLPTPEE